ncbi:tripartite motif-containing protein 16 [Bombina bombina]|uniref:tripartite motif-containing protein 16 n=1 Tax=Bombina bombina TaxID=8345 RepID=UPI00235B21F5|nr:tripartite motif-containing protein 16 [Bombina bombina]
MNMADNEVAPKPVYKCQSCGALPSLTLKENDRENKISKSHSVAQIGSPILSPTEPAGDSGKPEKAKIVEEVDDPERVLCDFCLDVKVSAVKTCLTCMVNYCKTHLRPHIENPKLHLHRLVEPLKDVELQSCSVHNKPLDWFCPLDVVCICEDCVGEKHNDHQTITCEEAKKQKEAEVHQIVHEYEWKLKSAENAILKLEANTTSIQNSVAEAKRIIDLSFGDLEDAVKRAHAKVLEFLEQRERAALSQSNSIQTYLQTKCAELKKSKTKAERIANHRTEAFFLQEFCEFKKAKDDESLPSVYIGLKDKLSGIGKAVIESTEILIQLLQTSYHNRLQVFAKEEELGIKTMVSAIVPAKHRISAPEPTTREDFLKYKTNVTLDPETVHCFLRLLQDNRKVTNTAPWQHPYPDSPERFEQFRQVLSSESFYMGRQYFEVEFKGEAIHIGLTYKGLDRKGSESNSNITGNNFSWTLKWNGKEFSAWHSDVEISLKAGKFSRVGVYVNYPGGTVSFYGVASAMTLLHTYECSFTEPLYAAFWLPKKENSVTIIAPDDMSFSPTTPLPSPEVQLTPTLPKENVLSSKATETTVTMTITTIKGRTSSDQVNSDQPQPSKSSSNVTAV